jgi:CxxC motif-containing protein (DUF1111 family)
MSSVALAIASSACADTEATTSGSSKLEGVTLVHDDYSNRPLPKLADEWSARFNAGDKLFDHTYLESQGLGPVYIRSSCSSCHASDGRGPGAVRKMVMLDADGKPRADQSGLTWGNTIRPQTIQGVDQGIVAPEDTSSLLITVRMPPATFGRGYMEAIADAEIERVEAEQAKRDDGISGRINWVMYTSAANPDTRFHAHDKGERLIGRFGLKARVATLDDFTADAMQGDMGITSDLRPSELPNPVGDSDELPGVDVPPDTVNLVADYMRMLRIPARELSDEARGKALFTQAKCDVCHVPSLRTARDYALPQLADTEAAVFTDMLLHDMGEGFGDGLHDFSASSSEWRTAPLMGLRFFKTYLHDGRAKSVLEAIELHGAQGSEGQGSAQTFKTLSESERSALVAYVSSL